MIKKIAKIFSKNRKVIFSAVLCALCLSLMPTNMAQAALWDPLTKAVDLIVFYLPSLLIRVPLFFIALIIGLLAIVAGVIFSIITTLLSWLITICLNVSITQNAVVLIGWAFTRDFINMFFLLILAIIGLAKILKLKNYEAEKVLPKLITVILLINFTPVLVGFVVDIANIFTNFFFNKTGEISSIPNLFGQAFNYITESFITIFAYEGNVEGSDIISNMANYMGSFASIMVYGLVLIMFYAFSAFTYLIVFVILFTRIIYLWILMILSPIAFFSQVLPEDSDLVKALLPNVLSWKGWWKEFVAWATIGIPIGFFLYLSNFVMSKQDEALAGFETDSLMSFGSAVNYNINFINLAPAKDLLGEILAPMISVAILWFGTMISIQSMPDAAKKIAEGVKKAKGKGIGLAGQIAAEKLGGKKGQEALGKFSDKVSGLFSPIEGAGPKEGAGILGRSYWAARKAVGKSLRVVPQATGKVIEMVTGQMKAQKDIRDEKEEKELEKMNDQQIMNKLANPIPLEIGLKGDDDKKKITFDLQNTRRSLIYAAATKGLIEKALANGSITIKEAAEVSEHYWNNGQEGKASVIVNQSPEIFNAAIQLRNPEIQRLEQVAKIKDKISSQSKLLFDRIDEGEKWNLEERKLGSLRGKLHLKEQSLLKEKETLQKAEIATEKARSSSIITKNILNEKIKANRERLEKGNQIRKMGAGVAQTHPNRFAKGEVKTLNKEYSGYLAEQRNLKPRQLSAMRKEKEIKQKVNPKIKMIESEIISLKKEIPDQEKKSTQKRQKFDSFKNVQEQIKFMKNNPVIMPNEKDMTSGEVKEQIEGLKHKARVQYMEKIPDKLREKISKNIQNNDQFILAMAEAFKGQKLKYFNNSDKEIAEKFYTVVEKNQEYLAKTNPAVILKAMLSPGATLMRPDDKTPKKFKKEIADKIRKYTREARGSQQDYSNRLNTIERNTRELQDNSDENKRYIKKIARSSQRDSGVIEQKLGNINKQLKDGFADNSRKLSEQLLKNQQDYQSALDKWQKTGSPKSGVSYEALQKIIKDSNTVKQSHETQKSKIEKQVTEKLKKLLKK